MQEVLHAKYYNMHIIEQERKIFQIRSQTKTSGTDLPKVHGIDKSIDPNLRPEKQIMKPLCITVQL